MVIIQEPASPIWEWPFSWDHASWIVGGLVAAALSVLALDDYKLAKAFFLIAAADAWGGVVMWGIKTDLPAWQRDLIVFVFIGGIGLLLVQSLRYVDKKTRTKEMQLVSASEPKSPPHTSVPPQSAPIMAKITWETPAPIVEGTPLTDKQLNARVSIDATPSYIPDLGTVLPLAGMR